MGGMESLICNARRRVLDLKHSHALQYQAILYCIKVTVTGYIRLPYVRLTVKVLPTESDQFSCIPVTELGSIHISLLSNSKNATVGWVSATEQYVSCNKTHI